MDTPNIPRPEAPVEIPPEETLTPSEVKPIPEKKIETPAEPHEQILPPQPPNIETTNETQKPPVKVQPPNSLELEKGVGEILSRKGPETATEAANLAAEVDRLQNI